MPPKKKKDAVAKKADDAGDKPSQQPEKQVSQQVKPAQSSKPAQASKPTESKPVQKKATQKKPVEKKVQDKKPEQKSQPVKTTTAQKKEVSEKKVQTVNVANLTEQERLARRKQKFLNEQKNDVLKARMQKFGVKDKKEEEQRLKQRRLKFSNNPALVTEDPQVLKKRRQKFLSTSQKEDDPSILQQRKAKFGANDIALDDVVLDSRPNHHNKFNKFKRSRPKHDSGRKFDNFHKRHRN